MAAHQLIVLSQEFLALLLNHAVSGCLLLHLRVELDHCVPEVVPELGIKVR